MINNRRSNTMTFKGAVALGMITLAACAGCATGTSSVLGGTSGGDGAGHASPALGGDQAQTCEHNGGWFDRVAGVCDSGS